ncbi:SMI1/KNR4 family protein [Peribacillus simplex]|uniref:SMI1/KNR4 family protein n=1 Tax=Peribacillus simplex TaxID=1478 RepID=UPI0009BFB3F3
MAEAEIFENENNIKLPEDYKAFLTLHNGAKMYELLDDDGEKRGAVFMFLV